MVEQMIGTGIRAADAIRAAVQVLRSSGIDSAERDARSLVAAAAGLSSLDLMREPERPLTEAEARRAHEMLDRRRAREPVSRILGFREFYGRNFKVTPATLDPRPETELLIDAALELADGAGWREREISILDIGTGTGCILLTLLCELPLARGTAIDIDPATLEVAKENARSLDIAHRVSFVCEDGAAAVEGKFDLLVSNPPYIPSRDIATLEPEVRDHDPRLALDGGEDGLSFYRKIAGRLRYVVPSGWVMFEVGAGQAESVAHLLAPYACGKIRLWTDLGGHARCVAAPTLF